MSPPTGSIPPRFSICAGLIKELAREATIIISTHILQEVQAVCDRVIIIQHGRKALDASLAELSAGQRLLVMVEDREEVAALLRSLNQITRVDSLSAEDGPGLFCADRSAACRQLAPAVADCSYRQRACASTGSNRSRAILRKFSVKSHGCRRNNEHLAEGGPERTGRFFCHSAAFIFFWRLSGPPPSLFFSGSRLFFSRNIA